MANPRNPLNEAVAGVRYGRLVVICEDLSKPPGTIWWFCKCDCGKEHSARGRDIRRGLTRSCGCLVGDVFRAMQPNLGRKWNHPHPRKGQKYGPMKRRKQS